MLDEERYKAIREDLQQSSPNSPQGFEILSRLAKIVGDKEMEKAAKVEPEYRPLPEEVLLRILGNSHRKWQVKMVKHYRLPPEMVLTQKD